MNAARFLLVVTILLWIGLASHCHAEDIRWTIATAEREAIARASASPEVIRLRLELAAATTPAIKWAIHNHLMLIHAAAREQGRAEGIRRHAEAKAERERFFAQIERDNNFARALRGQQ